MSTASCERRRAEAGNANVGALLAAAVAIALITPHTDAHAQAPWYYRLGTEKSAQQANLCITEQTVLELARVFQQQGPRAGYAALDRARDCRTGVWTFTPLAVVERVTIKTGDGGKYVVSFVKVKTASGVTEYLVTTRDVRNKP